MALVFEVATATSNHQYPYPALGAMVNSWTDEWFMNMAFVNVAFAIPLLISVPLMILSVVKILLINHKEKKTLSQ